MLRAIPVPGSLVGFFRSLFCLPSFSLKRLVCPSSADMLVAVLEDLPMVVLNVLALIGSGGAPSAAPPPRHHPLPI